MLPKDLQLGRQLGPFNDAPLWSFQPGNPIGTVNHPTSPKPSLGNTEPKLGEPKPRLGVPSPRLGCLVETPGSSGALKLPTEQLGMPGCLAAWLLNHRTGMYIHLKTSS